MASNEPRLRSLQGALAAGKGNGTGGRAGDKAESVQEMGPESERETGWHSYGAVVLLG